MNVSEAELVEFEIAVLRAALEPSDEGGRELGDNPIPRYFFHAGALVVSFDPQLRPFLCDTRGWNRNRRKPIKSTALISRIAAALGESRPEGGRVFLDASGVRTTIENQQIVLITWKLPRESNILTPRNS